MVNKFIRNYVAKMVAGRSDDGIMITLTDPKKVEFQTALMEELLMRRGFNPADITSEKQLLNIINQIKAIERVENTQSGIASTQSAKIFNIEGQSLDPNKPIIGGTQTGKELSPELSERLAGTNTQRIKQRISDREKVRNEMKTKYGFTDERLNEIENTPVDEEMADRLIAETDLPPPGSRGGKDDIAAPVQSQEESMKNMVEAEIKAKLEKQNKSAVENILKRKNREDVYGLEDYDTTNMSEIKKEIIRTETKLGNLNPNLPGFRERAKPLIDKITALQKKLREDKADGGRIGLKSGTGKKFLQKVFGKEKFEEMKSRDPEMYVGLLEVVDMYRKRDKEGLKMYLQKFLPHMDDETIEDFIRGSDGSEGLIGELIRLGSGRDYAGKIEMIKRAENRRKLDDLEVTEDMIRKPNADGGIMRLGFKEGSGMSRRTFLKILGGAMSIPIVGKILKPFKIGKKVTQVPIIKTDNVPGKPEWFDQLVNKVILEGDDVTKRFATKDREIVHMKKLDEDTNVTVYQDLDEGAVRVEYESPESMYGDPVSLRYKKPNPDEGDPRPTADFDVAESGPVGRADGPDDYSIDIDEVGGTSISDLTSDVSKLKQYATGQKPTLKEFVQSKKRKDKAKRITEGGEAEMDAVIERQGEFIENDLVDLDPPEFASGGIARMLGE